MVRAKPRGKKRMLGFLNAGPSRYGRNGAQRKAVVKRSRHREQRSRDEELERLVARLAGEAHREAIGSFSRADLQRIRAVVASESREYEKFKQESGLT